MQRWNREYTTCQADIAAAQGTLRSGRTPHGWSKIRASGCRCAKDRGHEMPAYKFRSASQLHFALDIIINNRLRVRTGDN